MFTRGTDLLHLAEAGRLPWMIRLASGTERPVGAAAGPLRFHSIQSIRLAFWTRCERRLLHSTNKIKKKNEKLLPSCPHDYSIGRVVYHNTATRQQQQQPWRAAISAARSPQMPLMPTRIISPRSSRLTKLASIPAWPVPLMAKVKAFFVWNAYWIPSLTSSIIYKATHTHRCVQKQKQSQKDAVSIWFFFKFGRHLSANFGNNFSQLLWKK